MQACEHPAWPAQEGKRLPPWDEVFGEPHKPWLFQKEEHRVDPARNQCLAKAARVSFDHAGNPRSPPGVGIDSHRTAAPLPQAYLRKFGDQ